MESNQLCAKATFVLAACASAVLTASEPTKQDSHMLPAILAAPLKPAAEGDQLQKAQRELYSARQELTRKLYVEYRAARPGARLEDLLDSTRRLMHTGVDANQGPKDKVEFLKQVQELADKIAVIVDARTTKPEEKGLEFAKVREFKLEVELQLIMGKRAAADPKK